MNQEYDDEFPKWGRGSPSQLNPRTPIDYKAHRKSRQLFVTSAQAELAAAQPVELVPIRLDLEHDGVRIKDQFTWNVHESVITPECFGQLLVDDLRELHGGQLIPLIANEIRRQVKHCSPIISLEDSQSESQETVAIKLDINIESLYLQDKFEWPLFSSALVSPEEFALQLAAELGASGEFTTIIAHAIREQLCFSRTSISSALAPERPAKGQCLRLDNMKHWQPSFRELTERDAAKISREQERQGRILRRQIRHMGRQSISRKRAAPV